MNDPFFKKCLSVIFLLTILMLSFHLFLLLLILPDLYIQGWWWFSYLFFIPITIIGIRYVLYGYKKNPRSAIKSYLFFTVLKMIGAVAFLSPWLLTNKDYSRPMFYQFFALFFPFLLVETILLIRLLNQPLDEK